MADAYSQDGPGIDPSSLLLIVVGADLRAELSDRAEARRLAQRTETWLARNRTAMNVALRPVICTDVWYLNDAALQALEAQAGTMPVGAVLVKENYMPDSTLAATTVMLTRENDHNPEHNGWWWLKRNADGTNEVVGRGAGCPSCHGGQAADNDYVVTGPLSGGQ